MPAPFDGSRPRLGRPDGYTAVSVTGPHQSDTPAGDVVVSEVTTVTPEVIADITDIATSPATVLLVARDDLGTIVGSLTLVLFRAPTGPRAWIEDVVVDTTTRGQGIGAALVRDALDRAASAGARTVDLTSRPSREAANRLYLRLGFEQRETNVYRWNHVPDNG
jgi:ribosomal protein S18 acetylase RimI-like enzyme